jgi:mono/diheme cytochrome c family protein
MKSILEKRKGDHVIKLCSIALFGLALVGVDAAQAADISHGRQLARRWCVSCHVVASNQRQTTSEAPPFSSIARRPDFDTNRLATFLLNPYPRMPSMSLSRTEAQDLAAYIGSLRR